jgi:hypothetical protein
MTPAKMIESYLKLRRKMSEVDDRHKEELRPFMELKEQLETELLRYLNTAGLDSTKCEAGTAYRSTSTSVSVKDWRATLEFIKTNELWDLLEARVAKTAAVELTDERKAPIPGVEISQATVLRVRAS